VKCKNRFEAGVTAQQLRRLPVLPEDKVWFGTSQLSVTPSPRLNPLPFSGLHTCPHEYEYIHTHTETKGLNMLESMHQSTKTGYV
jgi:hypothetical protein